MGATTINDSCFFCSKKKNLESKDLLIDYHIGTKQSTKSIILIQSNFRGFLLRKDLNNSKQIKEVSIDYSTEQFETNSMIKRLNRLLPKFELTDKEEYEMNNTSNKIIAILYPNQSVYKGMINSKGQRDGFGKYFLSDGSIYKGFFHNNKMEGRGRLVNIKGFVYEGEFKNGHSNGYGKYISIDGTSYKGTWVNDKQNGIGKEMYPDGSFYHGNFRNGKKNGNGKLVFKDKNIFEGNFINNDINGEGAFYWKDGRIYIGNWKDNKMNGYGIFIWPDKKKYYGNYINNLKEGFGCFFWNDGHKYEGFWKIGKQHGYGIMKGIKVSKYGYWSDGKLQTIITDDETIKYINNKINEAKMQKDYSDFLLNIQKYEKQITDGSSSQDTNSNSKGNYKITNNITDYK
jgi:hypothetical protein